MEDTYMAKKKAANKKRSSTGKAKKSTQGLKITKGVRKRKISKTTNTSTAKKNFISKAPIRRLMREEGASLISDDALALLINTLEKHAVETTKKALEIVKDDKRKRITSKDINWATRA